MLRIHCLVIIFGACLLLAAQQPSQVPASQIASIQSLIRSQRFDEALRANRVALKQKPADVRLYTLEGIILSLQQHPSEALAAFDHVLKVTPDDPAALRGEVRLLYATDDRRAIPLLRRILKATPEDKIAHEMLGMLDRYQGNCSNAIDQFKAVAAVIDKHPESLETEGYCLFTNSHFDEAIPVFQQLVSLSPDRPDLKYDLALFLVQAKQYKAAVKALEPMLPDDLARATDADLLSLASEAYEQAGDTPKAVALLRQAIVLDPTKPTYFTAFADLCLVHESFEVGIAMLDAGITRLPNEPSLYLDRGLLYAKLAEIDKAKADFKYAEQLDSSQSLSAYATDLAELESDHQDTALANLRAQLKVFPESPLLHYLLAKILDTVGSNDEDAGVSGEAFQSALAAARLKPNMVEAHDLLGTMYTRIGQYGKAIEECRFVLKHAPADESAMYHLLIALRHDGTNKHDEEIASLASRLSDAKKTRMKEETDHKRFKLVEQPSAPTEPANQN
jgi:tetratricopeptide (TPR) repeat protein